MSLVLLPPGTHDLVEGLADQDPKVRASSARRCGRPDLEVAVPLLGERLVDPDRSVRQAAAGALGRIGGGRSSDALLSALHACHLPAGRLARELARSAPDFYLEIALVSPENQAVRAGLAIAAGLRGRATAIDALVPVLQGSAVERAAAVHALGALGDERVIPLLTDQLRDPSPSVRFAAGRAVTRVRLRQLEDDPKPVEPRPTGALWRRLFGWLRRGSRRS